MKSLLMKVKEESEKVLSLKLLDLSFKSKTQHSKNLRS